jgi:hypothetical protein
VLAICLRCARVRRERFSRFDFRHWLPVRFVVLSSLFRFNLAARPDSLAVRPHCFGPWISSPHFCGCHCPDFLCRCGARADPARDFSSARGASLGPILSSWLRHETKFSCARGRGSSVPACFVHLPPAPISLCPPVDFAKDSFPHSLIFRAACSGLIRLPLGAFLIFSAWPNPSP